MTTTTGWHLAADHPITDCSIAICGWPSLGETAEQAYAIAGACALLLDDPRIIDTSALARLALFNETAAAYSTTAARIAYGRAIIQVEGNQYWAARPTGSSGGLLQFADVRRDPYTPSAGEAAPPPNADVPP